MPNIFQLVIEKATDEVESFDAKVSKTIEDIIERFFQKVENSLIYICSDDNEKAIQRHKIFDRWYKKSKHKSYVTKIDNIITVEIEPENVKKFTLHFCFILTILTTKN